MSAREYFTASAPTANGLVSNGKLAALYSEASYQFDLHEGTAVDSTNTRIIYLSTDIVRGIQAALSFEAGAAWSIVLKRSGVLWGKRTFKALNKQVLAQFGEKLPALSVPDLLQVLTGYMALHGWGQLRFDLSLAADYGVLMADLQHGMLNDALEHLRERADYLMCGMLGAFFSEISAADLDCVEINSPLLGASCSRFYVSHSSRIAQFRTLLDQGASEDEIRQRLA